MVNIIAAATRCYIAGIWPCVGVAVWDEVVCEFVCIWEAVTVAIDFAGIQSSVEIDVCCALSNFA